MQPFMAFRTKGNQVFFGVVAAPATKFLVVNL